jgi:putative DNA primase/helicase
MDRAIILELRRKLPHEQVDRLRYAEHGLFDTLAAKLSRFADDYSKQVRQARPALPSSLNDRAQDNWEPLLAIAMTAGPEWLDTATKAAMKLSGGESAAESIGVELLSDIQEIFDTNCIDRISTANLIQALIEDDEKPWATYNRGLPIKPRQIASRLKVYGILSKTVRFNQLETAKGYDRKQFEESFYRYVTPPEISVTESQVNTDKGLSVTDRQPCDVTKPIVTDNMEVF